MAWSQRARKARRALEALGVTTRDVVTGAIRPMNDIMDDVAEKFKESGDGPEKARVAIELFGRSGLNLVSYLNKGKDGLREMRQEFEPYTSDLDQATKAQSDYLTANGQARYGDGRP